MLLSTELICASVFCNTDSMLSVAFTVVAVPRSFRSESCSVTRDWSVAFRSAYWTATLLLELVALTTLPRASSRASASSDRKLQERVLLGDERLERGVQVGVLDGDVVARARGTDDASEGFEPRERILRSEAAGASLAR